MMIEPDNGFEALERECEYLFHTVLRIPGTNDEATVARP